MVHIDAESDRGDAAPRPISDRPQATACRRSVLDDLAGIETVESHQPIGLIEPVLAHQRRGDQGQRTAGIGDRTERGVIDALELVGAIEMALVLRMVWSLAVSAPMIIWVLWPAGANRGAVLPFGVTFGLPAPHRASSAAGPWFGGSRGRLSPAPASQGWFLPALRY